MSCCGKIKQAGHFAGALFEAAGAALAGREVFVPAAVKSARLEICAACEHLVPNAAGTVHQCRVCGCWLDGRLRCKACLATEECPLKKWLKTEIKP